LFSSRSPGPSTGPTTPSGSSARRAPPQHTVAWEWIGAGVEPTDVATWLQAGCWDPDAARNLTLAGVEAAELLSGDGTPRHWIDTPAGEHVPLVQAVADKHITATEAAGLINN
jgi:hypothetical protein